MRAPLKTALASWAPSINIIIIIIIIIIIKAIILKINRTYSFLFPPCYIFLPLTRQKPHRLTSPLTGKLQSNQTTSNATDWVIKTSLFLKPSSAKTFPQVFLPVKRNSFTKTSNYSSPHTFHLIEVGFICNFLAESLSASQQYLYDQ